MGLAPRGHELKAAKEAVAAAVVEVEAEAIRAHAAAEAAVAAGNVAREKRAPMPKEAMPQPHQLQMRKPSRHQRAPTMPTTMPTAMCASSAPTP